MTQGRTRAAATGLLALGVALLLAACGGGGGGGLSAAPVAGQQAPVEGLAIEPAILPAASREADYGVQLGVAGVPAFDVTFALVGGRLPAGLALDEGGLLAGRPLEAGSFDLVLEARHPAGIALARRGLVVDALGLVAQDGLVAGEAWAGVPVTLRVLGAAGPVTFRLADEAAGRLEDVDGQTGVATLLAGEPPAGLPEDVLRVEAEETATGRVATLDLVVRPDPTAPFQAGFGWSDVWYLDLDGRQGGHLHATDLQAALARLGLRDPASVGVGGTEADGLAELAVRRALLERVQAHFGWGEDAEHAPLAITFPAARPSAPYAAPAEGDTLPGRADRYSVLRFEWGSERGVFATALVDAADNAVHEHDASADGEEHGIFLEVVVEHLVDRHGLGTLAAAPVGSADLPRLRAILHGLPHPDARTAILAAQVDAVATSLAALAAHEIAHGLGLRHDETGAPDALMAAVLDLDPRRALRFTAAERAQLAGRALPGRGRTDVSSAPGGLGKPGPAGGLCTCRLAR